MQQQQHHEFPSTARLGDLVLGPNPRRGRNPADDEMRASIREKGVIQPVLVRPLDGGKFELRAGFTRYGLAKAELGDDYQLPIHVREMTDNEAEEFSLIENVHRGGMNPAEEAESAARIVARIGGDRDEAARRLGWSRSTLDKRLALMNCVEAVRDALVENKILLGHAELLAALAKDKQGKVLALVLSAASMPSVADLKAQIAAMAQKLSDAIYDKSDCIGCPNNSGTQSALFSESIGDGHCTNRDCYMQKTEGALEAKQDALKDEFPMVRIVRPGEDFTVVKLVAEGDSGVGQEQSKLCRTCANFGAAISAVPGKAGNVYKDLCFDSACNTGKVSARHKTETAVAKAAEAAEKQATSAGVSPEKVAEAGKQAAAKVKKEASTANPVKVQDSQRVKDYRLKVWRLALGRQLARDAELNDVVLLASALSGNGGKISGTKLQAVYAHFTKEKVLHHDIAQSMDAVVAMQTDGRSALRTAVAASIADGVDEHALIALVRRCNTDLSESWAVCKEYLDLLTKSEIENVAEQIGLKAHLDDKAYLKLFIGKKDEIVKSVLGVDAFEYAGKIPSNMTWK